MELAINSGNHSPQLHLEFNLECVVQNQNAVLDQSASSSAIIYLEVVDFKYCYILAKLRVTINFLRDTKLKS